MENISVQNWIPIKEILNDNIIQTKENKFIKIIKVNPINYELKSNLEKESILNGYRLFFNTCEFNTQILIQSRKEDLLCHIKKIEEKNEYEEENIREISEKYIDYIKELNKTNKSSSKNFYIIIDFISEKFDSSENFQNENEKQIIINNLNEKYSKIKECLSRTNNICFELKEEELINVFYSFFNKRKEEK